MAPGRQILVPPATCSGLVVLFDLPPAVAYGVLMFPTAAAAGFPLRSRTTEPMPFERSSA
ncbi:hypothetical protein [Streptosporangium sp. NPDC049644]|uniref:hypothetical protein n=1 Tax=Streptosporangium sp. NPDC049644 TaxID=3155507 RepID=UPI00341B1613